MPSEQSPKKLNLRLKKVKPVQATPTPKSSKTKTPPPPPRPEMPGLPRSEGPVPSLGVKNYQGETLLSIASPTCVVALSAGAFRYLWEKVESACYTDWEKRSTISPPIKAVTEEVIKAFRTTANETYIPAIYPEKVPVTSKPKLRITKPTPLPKVKKVTK